MNIDFLTPPFLLLLKVYYICVNIIVCVKYDRKDHTCNDFLPHYTACISQTVNHVGYIITEGHQCGKTDLYEKFGNRSNYETIYYLLILHCYRTLQSIMITGYDVVSVAELGNSFHLLLDCSSTKSLSNPCLVLSMI